MKYPTIENSIGHTPLVRLQRLYQGPCTVLLKLEGNNPAGSVKDRPALNMIVQAERRGDIAPGDTLIEATSGNTGIALAMAAAIKGYKMVLIMPTHMSKERKLAMQAYGAELIEVSSDEGMEGARDLALKMQSLGQGKVLDQFGNPDNSRCSLSFNRARNMGADGRRNYALCKLYGYNGNNNGCVQVFKTEKLGYSNSGITTGRWGEHSWYSALARSLFAQNIPG